MCSADRPPRRALAVVWLGVVASLLAGCGDPPATPANGEPREAARVAADPAGPLRVVGYLAPSAPVALPDDADVAVEVRALGAARPAASTRVPLAGRPMPVPFELDVPRAALEPGRAYLLRAGFAVGGEFLWISSGVRLDAGASGRLDVGALGLSPHRPLAFARVYACEGIEVRLGVRGDESLLQVDDEEFPLRRDADAPGDRFEALDDPATAFTVLGERAELLLHGRRYPDCRPVDAD